MSEARDPIVAADGLTTFVDHSRFQACARKARRLAADFLFAFRRRRQVGGGDERHPDRRSRCLVRLTFLASRGRGRRLRRPGRRFLFAD